MGSDDHPKVLYHTHKRGKRSRLPRCLGISTGVALLVSLSVVLMIRGDLPAPQKELERRLSGETPVAAPVKFMIHQTYKTCDPAKLPPHWQGTPRAWKEAFPEAEYRCWTDDELRNLIKRVAPWFLPTYDNYPYNIQRVDSSRYFLLYQYGGMYVDMDIRPQPNVTNIIRNSFLPVGKHPVAMPPANGGPASRDKFLQAVLFPSTFQAWWLPASGRITNAIMIAPRPGSTFFARVISNLQASYQTTYNVFYYMYILTSAGSRYINLQYLEFEEANPGQVQVLDLEVARTRLTHIEGNSWHKKDAFGNVADVVRPMID